MDRVQFTKNILTPVFDNIFGVIFGVREHLRGQSNHPQEFEASPVNGSKHCNRRVEGSE